MTTATTGTNRQTHFVDLDAIILAVGNHYAAGKMPSVFVADDQVWQALVDSVHPPLSFSRDARTLYGIPVERGGPFLEAYRRASQLGRQGKLAILLHNHPHIHGATTMPDLDLDVFLGEVQA